MIAAVEHNATETTVYELIRLLPELVAIGIPQDDNINTNDSTDDAVTRGETSEKQFVLDEPLLIHTKKMNHVPNKKYFTSTIETKTSHVLQNKHTESSLKLQIVPDKYVIQKRNILQTSDDINETSIFCKSSKCCRAFPHFLNECIASHKRARVEQ